MRFERVEEKATVLELLISLRLLRAVFLAPYRWASLPERWEFLPDMVEYMSAETRRERAMSERELHHRALLPRQTPRRKMCNAPSGSAVLCEL